MAAITKDLTKGSVTKNLILFSIPMCLSYMLQALYSSADALIVGQFSALGDVTGVTQGGQIIHILTNGISGLSTGGAVLISQYLGAKRDKELKETIQSIFALFAASAFALTVVMLLSNNLIIRLMQIPAEAVLPMKRYLQICEIGLLFIFFYNCISAVLQAMGDSRHPLIFVGISCAVNVVLDLILVGAFQMGAEGAAIATVFSQLLSVILSAVFLKKQQFTFDFKLSSYRFHRDKLGMLLKLGFPFVIMRTTVATSFVAVSGLANGFGLAASSAAGIVNKINNFATMPFSAMQLAISSMAGQNIGAKNIKRAQHTLFAGFSINMIIGGCLLLAAQLWPDGMLRIFSSNEELIETGRNFLRLFSLEYVLMPFSYSIHGLMTASGHVWIPSLDGLLASVVFRVPLAALFASLMGFDGIALGGALAVLGAAIPAVLFYCSGIWKKNAAQGKETA